MTSASLNSILSSYVVELRFTRRRPRAGVSGVRRMICTLNDNILNSVNGRTVLNYLPGSKRLDYDPSNKNLSLAWDILMQGFRMIPADTTVIEKQLPADETFWTYFNDNILSMSVDEKIQYMNG